jgi:arginase family enzyme
MKDDPNWPRASAWLAGQHEPDTRGAVAVVGIPMRLGSLSGGRFDLAPAAIRKAEARFSAHDPHDAAAVYDLRRIEAEDHGDFEGAAEMRPEEAFDPIRRAIGVALEDGVGRIRENRAVVVLGGDNSITRPGAHAIAAPLDRVGLLTLDAHHDLRDTSQGLTNGNPVRALLEDGLSGANVIQVGLQPFANSFRYAEVARDAGITVVPVGDARSRGVEVVVREAIDNLASRVDAIYVDLDLDVLDRAFAPACPGSRPGGLAPWEVLAAARVAGAHPKVRAIDIVEVDPERDVAEVTVLTAAACLLSFAAGVAARSSGRERG